jgi:hypothetical protein
LKVPQIKKKSRNGFCRSGFLLKDLAATYSRASYTGTTIGKAVFDGRVRDGIGSDHSFMATKNWSQNFAIGILEDPDRRLTKCKRTFVL